MSAMHARVSWELASFPRGERGSSQNIFRAAYAAFRLNSLGRRPQIANSAAAAFRAALAAVRTFDPTFAVSVTG